MNQAMAFRAGRAPGEKPLPPGQQLTAIAPRAGVAAVTLLADISEFQPELADAAYLAWSQAIVIRAMYGSLHDDAAWYHGARRDGLLAGGCRFLGIYQYLAAAESAVTQAQALARLLVSLNPGEKIICDLEEGAGSQLSRWQAWKNVITAELGDDPWLYSGEWFATSHQLAPVTWVAAYGQAEPAAPHTLWQFTDAYQIPGVGRADCSVAHMPIDRLAALAWQGGTQPAPAPQPAPVPAPVPAGGWTEVLMSELPELAFGASGEDVKTAQGLLIARGYPVTADGSYGPATRAAMAALQHARGLVPDGICGQHTWYALHDRTG